MKFSEILKRAKVELETDTEFFICHAIKTVVLQSPLDDYQKALKLITWIESMINPHNSLTKWAINIKAEYPSVEIPCGIDEQTKHRIQWLDQLIAICEKDGD